MSVEGAEEAHVEFTEEETAPEEVRYSLGEAQKESAKPSLVGTQEQVVEPEAGESFESTVSVNAQIHTQRHTPTHKHTTLLATSRQILV